MKHTKFTFRLHDGKGGTVIYPEPVTLEQVTADLDGRFGGKRLKGVKCG